MDINEKPAGNPGALRVCRKCLILEGKDEAVIRSVTEYLARIKPGDRVSDEEYERRLSICRSCDSRSGGTCNKCGCYCDLRAAVKNGHCPKGAEYF